MGLMIPFGSVGRLELNYTFSQKRFSFLFCAMWGVYCYQWYWWVKAQVEGCPRDKMFFTGILYLDIQQFPSSSSKQPPHIHFHSVHLPPLSIRTENTPNSLRLDTV